MTTKADIMASNVSPLHSKFSTNELLSGKSSNTSYKRPSSLMSSNPAHKNSNFSNIAHNQDSNFYGNTYISNSAISSNGAYKKSPVKSLVIDTNDELSKYSNMQNNHLGSYTTTHQTSNSYNFTRNSLVSGLNGNLTTKFTKAPESYKNNLMPSTTKGGSSTKFLIPSANFPYSTTSQASKDFTNTTSNVIPDSISNITSPSQAHFKSGVTSKHYSVEPNKSASLESNTFEGKGILFNRDKNVYPSYSQQENQNLQENSSSAQINNRNDIQSNNQSNNNYNNENIPPSSKTTTTSNSNANYQQAVPPANKKLLAPIPNHEPTKCSVKRNGIVKAYAANTNQGIVRNYNEDRVSIILNIMKPASRINEDWPKCSFFGVYDGHGGVTCADFLRDNLHQYVMSFY